MLRKMEVSDIDKVVEFEIAIFGDSLGYSMLYNEVTSNQVAKYYIYEENKEFIGYLGSWQQADYGEIVNFLVNPKYQGQGYGSKILKLVLEDMKQNKVINVSLDVREGNKKAISLYIKYDFVHKYTRNAYYANKENALVMMKQM